MIEKTEKEIMQNWQGDINNPLVSIVCITYNHEKYISQAIDSFLMQETDFPFEIIIGEDCSPDNTREILNKYIEKYPNIIKAILRDKNIGANLNFIDCIENSKGKYIAICEGDDYWIDKNKLNIQVNILAVHKNINLCFSSAMIYNDNKNTFKKKQNNPDKDGLVSVETLIENNGGFISTPSTLYRKEILLSNLSFVKNIPIGDYFCQVLSSVPNGAYFLADEKVIYRKFSTSSLSTKLSNPKKRLDFCEKILSSYDDLNKKLNFKYDTNIRKRKKSFLINNSILFIKSLQFLDFLRLVKLYRKSL